MSLKQKIGQDFKEAFKNKEHIKKGVLSMVNAEIKNVEIQNGSREVGLTDEEILSLIAKMVKQRRDSINQFVAGNRDDLAEVERAEVVFLEAYLPEQMTKEEIEVQIKKVIEELDAKDKKDLGKIMGKVMANLKGKADGNQVREIATKLLN